MKTRKNTRTIKKYKGPSILRSSRQVLGISSSAAALELGRRRSSKEASGTLH